MNKNVFDQAIGEPVIDWQEKEYPSCNILAGRFCRLERLKPKRHAQSLFTTLCDRQFDENWTYLPYGPFADYDLFYQWLSASAQLTDPLFFSVIDQATNQAVGLVSYLRVDPQVGAAEVGHIHFSSKIQQTAIASESMYLMMQYLFDELGYRRYEWKCDSLNAPSKKAALRLGFEYEGTFKQATIYKNRNRDTAWYAIVDKQWPMIKQGFERWLAAENFDDKGRQKSKLTTGKALAI
ncbi:GNAT family protein [Gammaproteobacteria bacterium AS21]